MPAADVELIRDQYDAVNKRDWERSLRAYAEDVELVVHNAGVRGGTYSGIKALYAWFEDWFRSFDDDASFKIRELTELGGGRILVVNEHHARGRASGIELEESFVWVYEIANGKIRRQEAYDSREEAIEATS